MMIPATVWISNDSCCDATETQLDALRHLESTRLGFAIDSSVLCAANVMHHCYSCERSQTSHIPLWLRAATQLTKILLHTQVQGRTRLLPKSGRKLANGAHRSRCSRARQCEKQKELNIHRMCHICLHLFGFACAFILLSKLADAVRCVAGFADMVSKKTRSQMAIE